jgi:hypothetical protein
MIIQDKAIIAVKSLRNNVIFMPASESNRRTCYNLPGMQVKWQDQTGRFLKVIVKVIYLYS